MSLDGGRVRRKNGSSTLPTSNATRLHSSTQDTPVLLPASSDLKRQKAVQSAQSADSPVYHVYRALGQLRNGNLHCTSTPGYAAFTLDSTQFGELHDRLSSSNDADSLGPWYRDRVRYDYEASLRRYTLRMPTAVHECFTASVVNAMDRAIADLVSRLSVRKGKGHAATLSAVKRVFKGASTTIELDAPDLEDARLKSEPSLQDCKRRDSGVDVDMATVRRSPDASFYHHDAAELPQMVVEVSYSQQRHHLARLAESYIVDSRHAIRCVLGLDIPYVAKTTSSTPNSSPLPSQSDRTATISVWRPAVEMDECGDQVGVCVCDMDAVTFRNSDNSTSKGALSLSLADLLPPTTLESLPAAAAHERICITFAELASFLTAAEEHQATMTARSTRVNPTSSPTKFRKRKRSPSVELSDEREMAYVRQELAEMKKDRQADRAWRSPSSNRVVWHDVKRRRSPRHKATVKTESDVG